MKTLKINLISKVILLLFFILVIYFAYKFVNNNKNAIETFQSTSRNNRYKCIAPNLVNVNYNKKESDKMVKDYNLKHFTNSDGDFNYLSLIENKQPFDPINGDCVCEVKQSAKYIWYLNEKRNQILRVKRDKLLDKEYENIFTNIGTKKRYITAWGVSEDEENEYCIVFVRDIDFLNNSATTATTATTAATAASDLNKKNYFIIFKASIDTSPTASPIDLYNPLHRTPDAEDLPEEIYTTLIEKLPENFDIFGDIFIKVKSENSQEIIFNIFCLNYFDKDYRFGIVNTVVPVACSLKFKKIRGSPIINSGFEVDTSSGSYTPITIFQPTSNYTSNDYNHKFSESELFGDIKTFYPVGNYKYPIYSDRNKVLLNSDNIWGKFAVFIIQIDKYFTEFNSKLDSDPNKNEGKKLNLALTKFSFNNLFDFKLEKNGDTYVLSLYKNDYSYSYVLEKLLLECKIVQTDYEFDFENIGSGVIGTQKSTNELLISNTNLGNNIVLHNDKYLFTLKRGVPLNKLDEKFKDVRIVGQHKYNKVTDADNPKKQLQTYYNFKYISFGADNIQGVLEFDKKYFANERSEIIRSIIDYPYNIYFTLYQDLEKQGSTEMYFGRVYLKDIVKMTSICFPSQKFNFDNKTMNTEINKIINGINENDVGATTGAATGTTCFKGSGFNAIYKQKLNSRNVLKLSLYDFFKDNQTKEGEPEDKEKFKNPQDWILLYYMMRISGLYDLERQDSNLEQLNDNIDNSDLFQFNRDKWTNKHKDILVKGVNSKQIYQEKSKIDMFPNISLFSTTGSDGNASNKDEEKVYIHLKYKVLKGNSDETIGVEFSEEIVKEEYNFLKLVSDTKRNANSNQEVANNENKIDGIIYNYFKLEQTPKIDVEKGTDDLKAKHTWTKKTVKNFEDFKNIVLGTSKFRNNEIDPRDRIRGIYELNTMYVDEYYIDFLKSNNTEFKTKKTIIEEKQKEVDTFCFDYDEKGKKINRLGYPFIVFYQDIDFKGVPCSKHTEKKQRIFLCNRVHPGDIKCDEDITTSIKGRYPLIKQEFLSFSGYGNIIQFYEVKFGGLTSIQTAKLCKEKDIDIPGSCSLSTSDPNQNCNQKKLSMVNLDGHVKCEVENPLVKRTEINPIEVLVPGMVDKHACDIFILKGDKKIYFTLGKIFGNVDGELGLSKKYNTVKNHEGKYLFYDKDTQKIITKNSAVEDTPNGEVVPNGFKFVKKFESDNYGNYYLISPRGQEGLFLTSKIDLYQHTLGGGEESLIFGLEGKKDVTTRNHLNDEDYYSQKFIVNDSLFYADLPKKDQINKEMQKKIEANKKIRYMEASIYPEIAVGDKSFNPAPNDKEKQEMLKELLHNIKRFQRAKNERSSVNLENLGTQLPKAVNETEKIIPSRKSLIQKQLHHLHHTIGLNDKFEEPPSIYSKFEIPKVDEKEKNMAKKISNNNKDMFTEGQIIETGNALQKIKDFVPKNTKIQRKPSQCRNLNEGFENIYHPAGKFHNHVVDKYNKFVVDKTQKVDEQVTEIKDKLFEKLKSVSNKINDIKLDGNKEQIKLSQEVENSLKLEDTIHEIKEDEQIARMDRMRDKIKEIQKIKCQLGDVNYKKKVKDHPKYNSIMSREDGSFMNIYKIDKKCDGIEADNLNKNMIFINGGCLSYDEEKMRLNIEHCHVDNENQHFNLHQVNDLKGMDDLTIYHNGKDLERPHYVITKNPPKPPQEESGGPSESIYSNDECAYNYAKFNEYNSPAETDGITCDREVQRKLCLHKEDGEISMRKCNNITNQQWDHSDITSHCN